MRKSKKLFIPVLVIVLLAVSVYGFLVYWDNHGMITKVDSIEEVAEYGATDFSRPIIKIIITFTL